MVKEWSPSGTAVARYAQGLGIDEPLAINRGGASYFMTPTASAPSLR